MRKPAITVTTCLALSIFAFATFGQDPLKVAPNNYKLLFENEWVKVTRVHYGPREKIPAHAHTEFTAAYVYLNDCGPVIFRHINEKYGDVTRPVVKAGSFRLFRTIKEIHEVENPNDMPSDFLRVEFKTVEESGRREPRSSRPPTPPDVRFRIRRFTSKIEVVAKDRAVR